MRKQIKSQIVRVERAEIVAPDRNQQAEQFKLMIAQAIEKQVGEALSTNDSIFQPFFQSQSVAHEIKRRQTVAEQQKYVNRFKKYGCMICETKDRPHQSLSMCATCYRREVQRLREVVREHSVRDTAQLGFIDTVRLARAALEPSIKVLAGTYKERQVSGPRFRGQNEAAREAGIDKATLKHWLTTGKFEHPQIKLSAGKWLWSDEDVERLRTFASQQPERTRDSHGRFSLEPTQEKTAIPGRKK
jgi:MerR-like DNA binding protein